MKIAKAIRRLSTETAFKVFQRSIELEKKGKEIIHLSLGQPDFPTPKNIIESAKKDNKTRAQMSMRVAKEDMNDGIVVIGNAPTALLEVIEMVREGITKPALVIGIPVGFVSAVESKDELSRMDIPFITNQGRKGGSPCASAIVNALYKLLRQEN